LIASAALASILLLAVFVMTGSYCSADLQAKNAGDQAGIADAMFARW